MVLIQRKERGVALWGCSAARELRPKPFAVLQRPPGPGATRNRFEGVDVCFEAVL
jgi:hypothetical protein